MHNKPSNLKFQIEAILRTNAEPHELIGRSYRFYSEHGSHHEDLCGIIQAVGSSDEGGLALYVSPGWFWGMPLLSLNYIDGRWSAYVECREDRENSIFPGELEVYDLPKKF